MKRITICLLSLCAITVYSDGESIIFPFKQSKESGKNVACLEISGSIADSNDACMTLHNIKEKADALLLIINSGGGNSGASEAIAREVHNVSEKIPVVVYIKDACLSGAYLIAAHADQIIAPEMALVGSIGAYTGVVKENFDSIQQSVGDKDSAQETISGSVSYEIISASEKKVATHPLSGELSEEDRQYLMDQTQEIGELFAEKVATARNLHDNRDDWATGEMFTGKTAYDRGLIDQHGTHSDALHAIYSLLQNKDAGTTITHLSFTRWKCQDNTMPV